MTPDRTGVGRVAVGDAGPWPPAPDPNNNDGTLMLPSRAGQPQQWPIDVAAAATMAHRCGCLHNGGNLRSAGRLRVAGVALAAVAVGSGR